MADTLDALPAGRWAAIRAVTHSQRQRLLEAVIALRRCDARCVHITVL